MAWTDSAEYQRFEVNKAKLAEIKADFKAALEEMGQVPTDDWRAYSDLFRAVSSTAGGTYQDEKTVEADPAGMVIEADEGFDGIIKAIIKGEPNFRAWHMAEGLSWWGKTGTAKPKANRTGVPDGYMSDDPENPEPGTIEDAKKQYNAVTGGDADEVECMILESNGDVTYGFFLENWDVTAYDPTTTEFSAIGWRRLSWHKETESWTYDDCSGVASTGWNYIKNIRYCSREKLFYKGAEIFPFQRMGDTLLPTYDWYKGSINKRDITKINILNAYEPIGEESESWMADVAQSGGIMCYVVGTELIISNNVSRRIVANQNSRNLFKDFKSVSTISGLELMDMSRVESMQAMFYNCRALTTLDLSSFDTSNTTRMSEMFFGCIALTTLDVSSFDTRKLTYTDNMFRSCSALTSLDLSSFDTSNLSSMWRMFYQCAALKIIYVGSGWDTDQAYTDDMFYDCGVQSVTYK